ncbi:23732_t:CDS:2, partial [Cetraspora pellucida]
ERIVKKESEIIFLKSELTNIKNKLANTKNKLINTKNKLALKINEIEYLGTLHSALQKTKDILDSVVIGGVEKNSKAKNKVLYRILKIHLNLDSLSYCKEFSTDEISNIKNKTLPIITNKQNSELFIQDITIKGAVCVSEALVNNNGSSSQDVFKIVGQYTDDVKSASMVINSYLHKNKFIVFDLNRAEDNSFAIWLGFDILLDLQKEIELHQK